MLIHTVSDELHELLAASVDDSQRPVASTEQGACRLNDVSKHDGKIEVARDRNDGVEKRTKTFLRVPRALSSASNLAEEILQVQCTGTRELRSQMPRPPAVVTSGWQPALVGLAHVPIVVGCQPAALARLGRTVRTSQAACSRQ